MSNCCYSFLVIHFFVDSQATRALASFHLATADFCSSKCATNIVVPWGNFLSETLQLFIKACLSNNECKTESSCATVNITAESRHCFISRINIQLSIAESFLLQVNVGGGLGTNKSKSHTIVKWSDVS